VLVSASETALLLKLVCELVQKESFDKKEADAVDIFANSSPCSRPNEIKVAHSNHAVLTRLIDFENKNHFARLFVSVSTLCFRDATRFGKQVCV
jgi:hypothetical protein